MNCTLVLESQCSDTLRFVASCLWEFMRDLLVLLQACLCNLHAHAPVDLQGRQIKVCITADAAAASQVVDCRMQRRARWTR